jgi:oxygen-independent coproporphyrinogen III oxidase
MNQEVASLIARYDRPGPRYTSYPTAPQFTTSFEETDYRALLSRRRANGLSLYVHLPFCRSLCSYCGCHMKVTKKPEVISRYVEYVKREIDLVGDSILTGEPVRQVHWGGGTPTYLEPEDIEGLMAYLRSRFTFDSRAEISIEADPRGLRREHLSAAARAGFNRISFGVQCFDPDVQQAIGRIQPAHLVWDALRSARAEGFSGVSFDLIYGLPHQTPVRFAATLDQTIEMAPDRISLFSYAHVPWMKRHQALIRQEWLPTAPDKMDLFLMAIERLMEAGYERIGMDHFARRDDPLAVAMQTDSLYRNFQGYSTHAGLDVIALGVSGISQLEHGFAQNVKSIPDYYRSLDAGRLPIERGLALSDDDRLRRDLINRLMCDMRLDIRSFGKAWEIDFDTYFPGARERLAEFQGDGLLTGLDDDDIVVTENGRLFIRNVAMIFDAYLDLSVNRPLFSRTV